MFTAAHTDSAYNNSRRHMAKFGTAKKGLTALIFAGAIALSACGDKGAATGAASAANAATATNPYLVEGDHVIGSPDAPVTIVEYASVTCGHCANWHEAVWPTLRKDYVDTGKVQFVYREFPTSPVRLAEVGFMIANCAAEDKFFANIALQYEKQTTLIDAAQIGRAGEEYAALARAAGLSEEDYEACLANEEEYARIQEVVRDGFEAGVTGTPSFFINGEQKKVFRIEEFDEELANFVDVPTRESAEATESDGH